MSGLNSARSAWQIQRALAAVTGLVIMGSTPPADGDWMLPLLDSGSFYVSSYSNDRVCLYASDGSFIRDFASPDLDGPRGIVVRSDRQELYVAGQNSDAIHVFDTSGNTLRTFSGGGLDGPTGMAIGPGGELYVASFNTDEILVFSEDDGFLRSFTGGGLYQLVIDAYPARVGRLSGRPTTAESIRRHRSKTSTSRDFRPTRARPWERRDSR